MSEILDGVLDFARYALPLGFYALVAGLVAGRVSIFALRVAGRKQAASRLAGVFNHYTLYLRP